ncbi:MFS transporter [Thermus thermophilus]|uniref:Nitrate transporter n=1 Tax=Thermus thermophilus TaxID=274 RepID=A0AAD1KXR3_THETH|nr:MFS transporter [Thermus thermophilus]BCZ88080.1 nitrate transporter [Thermus thermophilus]BCZ90546.1 nitrate transporter [Thermus thermophilus]
MSKTKATLHVRSHPLEALVAATVGFFVGFAAVALFNVTAKTFKEAMGLDPVQVGLLVAMPNLSGSLLRIPFSAWVDTDGGRRPMLTLLGLALLGMLGLIALLLAYYPDGLTAGLYPVLLFLGFLSGCGIATFSVGISFVSYWFPQNRQGWALGTYAGVGNLAPGLFTFLLPTALAAWGLLGTYVAWTALLLLGTLVFYALGYGAPYFQLLRLGLSREEAKSQARALGQELFPAGSLVETLARSAAKWRTWVLVALYFTSFGGFLALTAWLPTYWREFLGQDVTQAAYLTAYFSILASVVRVFGGSLSDRIGGERAAFLAYGLVVLGALLLTQASSFGLAFLGETLLGFGMGVGNAAVFKMVPYYVPDAVGGASGWVGGLGATGGFVVPPVLGYFVRAYGEARGYPMGYTVYVALGLLALLLVWLLSATKREVVRAQERA